MARLNEPPLSTDSLETLRRKMMRQNRELAKMNNLRALRIRELETECGRLLSENLDFRGRILELENELDNGEMRRIADHAVDIKARLEAQLTEWGTILASLGMEPSTKRHSPAVNRTLSRQHPPSFSSARPSPSSRRLRDVAKEIGSMGSISEHKISEHRSTSRRSMNPEQILALRSEAEEAGSPELGPPPVSKFIDDPVKIQSPAQVLSPPKPTPSLQRKLAASPIALPSPDPKAPASPSPQKKPTPVPIQSATVVRPVPKEAFRGLDTQPLKAGAKRKFSNKEEVNAMGRSIDGKVKPSARQIAPAKTSVRERAGSKTLKELSAIRKEGREKPAALPRKPLGAKNSNDSMSSPRKAASTPSIVDEVAIAKADYLKSKASQEKTRLKSSQPAIVSIAPPAEVLPATSVREMRDLADQLAEQTPLSPTSPEPILLEETRGDTPPPADISHDGESNRPSRRNRTAVSYAEPNLRDKMRRPTKELFDAVAGEGKYSRRTSQCEPVEAPRGKRESYTHEAAKRIAEVLAEAAESDPTPVSPLARKSPPPAIRSVSVNTERRRRPSAAAAATKIAAEAALDNNTGRATDTSQEDDFSGDEGSTDVDLYEFNPSSPPPTEDKKKRGRPSAKSRRFSAALDEDGPFSQERPSSRRRSMML